MLAESSLAASLTLLKPPSSSRYNQVYADIAQGIESRFDGEVETQIITDGLQQQSRRLSDSEADVIIGLGRQSYKIVKGADLTAPILFGALPFSPNQGHGVSLILEPYLFFQGLKALNPDIERVHVAYSRVNRWLVDIASKQALSQGLTLLSYPVDDLAAAAKHYQEQVENLSAKTDAIWIPLDPISANEKFILPQLLKQSWRRLITVFASKPSLVKRGVLFAYFPDHFHMGEQLGYMANQTARGDLRPQFALSNSAGLFVNIRTAEHLGLTFSEAQRQEFALTFPE